MFDMFDKYSTNVPFSSSSNYTCSLNWGSQSTCMQNCAAGGEIPTYKFTYI